MPVLPGHLEDMSPSAHRHRHRPGTCRWETIQYALDSTARTVRLCVIMLVASVPPGAFVWLLLHR